MTRTLSLFVILTMAVHAGAICKPFSSVTIDFASSSNPAVSMSWTDAQGQLYNGSPNGGISGMIPY